jgi:hypothetical protein
MLAQRVRKSDQIVIKAGGALSMRAGKAYLANRLRMWWRHKHKSAIPLTHHASLVTICLFIAGCALVAPKEEAQLPQAKADELAALLRQREAAIQTMKGLFSAKVRGGLLPIASRVEGAVYFRRPHTMRLRGFTPIGGELFEFIQNDEAYVLRLPTMGRVLSGKRSEMGDMGKLARPFQLSVWAMGGVLGTGSIAANETVKLVEESERYRLEVYTTGEGTGPKRQPTRRLWFDRKSLLVVQEDRLNGSGEVDATIQYEDFRPVGELLPAAGHASDQRLLRPFKVLLEDGKGQGSVQVLFHEIQPNSPLKNEELGRLSLGLPESRFHS